MSVSRSIGADAFTGSNFRFLFTTTQLLSFLVFMCFLSGLCFGLVTGFWPFLVLTDIGEVEANLFRDRHRRPLAGHQ